MHRQRVITASIAALLCVFLLARPAVADGDGKRRRDGAAQGQLQQDQVLEAVKRKDIRPLAEIQAAAEKAMPGQVVGVEIKRRDGKFVYEFKIVAARGRLREIYVDAATLEILKIE